MNKILLASLLLCAFALNAVAQDYTMLCDSNGVARPGFYFPTTNLVGSLPTNVIPTNVASVVQLNLTSNAINTNLLARIATNTTAINQNSNAWIAATNNFNIFTNLIGNVVRVPGTNSVILGGRGNVMYNPNGSVIIGGSTNTHYGLNGDSTIVGGFMNQIYSAQNTILGGQFNGIGTLGTPQNSWGCVVLGGTNNQVGNRFNVVGGVNASAPYNACFVWAGGESNATYAATADGQVLFRAPGGFAINTNNPGTNALRVVGYVDITPGAGSGITIGGTNIFSLFPVGTTSNGIIATINTTSNALLATINTASNTVAVAALNAQTSANLASNATVVASNTIVATFGPRKAFTAHLPATFTSQGQAFNVPLMPDGDFSVALTPLDAQTAASQWTNAWWVGSKSASGFTIYIPVQNSFDLNFDCTIHDNTQ